MCGDDTMNVSLVKVCVSFIHSFILRFYNKCGDIRREVQICMLRISKPFKDEYRWVRFLLGLCNRKLVSFLILIHLAHFFLLRSRVLR